MDEVKTGTLYIVATPIGNSRDMSPRGRQILEEADMIAAEDTRRSMVLLNMLGVKNKLVSNHKFNEYGKAKYFVGEMLAGKSVELEVFWFDGTSLQPIPSTQLKFISQIVSQKLSSCAPRRVIEFVWMQVEPFVPVCRRFGVVPNPNNLLTTATLINERAPHRRSILSRAC